MTSDLCQMHAKARRTRTAIGCKASMKSEQDVLVLRQGKIDENTRATTICGLKCLRKIREAEETTKELLEEVKDRKH